MIMISVQDEVGVQSEQSLHYEWISQSFALKCILQRTTNETTIETTNTTVASSRRCSILVSHFEFLASVFDLFPIYPLQVGVCVRRTMNIRNGIKAKHKAT
jgi:hypothetical protein